MAVAAIHISFIGIGVPRFFKQAAIVPYSRAIGIVVFRIGKELQNDSYNKRFLRAVLGIFRSKKQLADNSYRNGNIFKLPDDIVHVHIAVQKPYHYVRVKQISIHRLPLSCNPP